VRAYAESMLVFVDESGDTGLKITRGSTPYFVISLCLFDDHEAAIKCDREISELRNRLKRDEGFEFHFYHNSDRIRKRFLEAIAPFEFVYFAFVLNKDPEKLWGEGFRNSDSFYKAAAHYVFENARPYLREATVVFDKRGEKASGEQIARYLKRKLNSQDRHCIKKVKSQHSHSNNLLQLADYISGVVNRKVMGKKNAKEYHRFIAHREMYIQIWPK
jgi:hypothetical protein